TFIDDQTYQINYPHLLSWRHPNHVAWGNTQANYFFGDTPNSYYDSSQRAGHHTHPWLKPVSLFQIFFDEETGLFEHHHLTSFLTAGKWNEDAPETCDYSVHENCAYNWTESPLPWADSTGRKLFFTSTMGTYSHTDYHIKGVTPYGGAGVFVALLEPASNPDSCIDSDGDGFGPHCVAGPDCDDSNYFINPNAKEVFDGRDNNCNGQVDCEEDPSLVCSPKALFVDTDSLGGACSDVRERAESSYTTPFCTIQRASDMALPGDSIWIREGEYAESLDIDQGGTSETHRIVFRALPNELVVIRPGKRYGNPWGALGGGVYQKSFVGISQDIETLHAISYNGSGIVEVSNVEDLMNSEYAGGIDLLHIDYENKLVTLRLVSATPSQVYFVDESSSVTVRAPYVTFEDVRIEYAYRGLRVRSYGVFDDFSEHGHHFSMIHSEIAHTFAEAVHSSRDNLILRGNLFEYNGVRHKIKEGEVEREDNATALLLFGDNALVEENEVRETSTALNFRTSSVEPGYAVRGFIFRKNFFRARVVGSGKDNLFYNNLVYEPEQTGFSLYYQTENNRIYNNIFHSQYGVLLSRYGIGRDVHFKNNIVVGTIASRCLDLGDGDVSQYHLDHNIYDTCVLFSDTNGTISNTFSGYLDFISPYGQEAHSSMQDPMVVLNPDDRQPYTPLGGSPVIDNGEDFSSLFAEDYVGNGREQGTWDIGPYEFQ
ncbi:MAG: putative metal-binding motif-containing protein, partial [Bdellovibrionales bacterium]|nr:putative metal-binding motif-containing protein [Bdellovibrionales bacterium]